MTSLNPFLDDEYDATHSNSTLSSSKAKPTNHSLDEIAEELLKNKYILTALEFYTEIQERGNDLHRLKNYFSNPSHFDLPVNYKDAFGGGSLCKFKLFIFFILFTFRELRNNNTQKARLY